MYKFGWTTARALKAGDVLVLSNGRHVVVEWVDHEITESPVLVYNFEVEDFHTYFVGESGILVHNGKYGAAGQLGCGTSASKSAEVSEEKVTVGRWMSEDEFTKMNNTGEIQPSIDNPEHKYVAYPSDPDVFGKQAPKGSVYVEFDIPESSVRKAGSRGIIPGPGSRDSRLSVKRGGKPIEFPKVSNIRKVKKK